MEDYIFQSNHYVHEILRAINFWFWLFMCSVSLNVYLLLRENEFSLQYALNHLKKHLIRLILFYQANYSDSDQIQLVRKWIENIDTKEVPNEQMKLFKEFINKL